MNLRELSRECNMTEAAAKEALKNASMRCFKRLDKPVLVRWSPEIGITYVDHMYYVDTLNNIYYNRDLKPFVSAYYVDKGLGYTVSVFSSELRVFYSEMKRDRFYPLEMVGTYNVYYMMYPSHTRHAFRPVRLLKKVARLLLVPDCVHNAAPLPTDRSTDPNDRFMYRTDGRAVFAYGHGWMRTNDVSSDIYGNLVYLDREDQGIRNNCRYYLPKSLLQLVIFGNSSEEWILKAHFQAHQEDFYVCPDCGKVYRKLAFERCFHSVCQCHDMQIYSYHGWNGKLEFLKTDAEADPKMYFGTEIEIQTRDENRFLCSPLRDVFHLERDGSISGFEMISQPMTWAYVLANKERIQKMFEALLANGAKAHDGNNCGLHIHVSKAAFTGVEAMNRFTAMIHALRPAMETFARRKNSSYYSYYMLPKNLTREDIDNMPQSGHNVAVNAKGRHSDNCNSDTIEVRIFKSTLNINTYLAAIELVANMVKVANNPHKMHVTFRDLVFGEYVPAYVQEREEKWNNVFDYETSIDFACYNLSDRKAKTEAAALIRKAFKLAENDPTLRNAIRRLAIREGGIR